MVDMISGRRGERWGLWSALAFSTVSGCGASKHNFDRNKDQAAGAGGEGGAAAIGMSGNVGRPDVEAGAAGAPGEPESCTAGIARTCYASEAGDAYPGMPPANQVTCKLGEQTCGVGGIWGSCAGAVGPAAADGCETGNDANCNGVPNEGCTCATGETCSSGTVCSADGSGCKLSGGQPCAASADCASAACMVFNLDADRDGYRADAAPVKFCGSSKAGYVLSTASKGDDCNDANSDINPGASEICDGIDNNCNNVIDMADNGALKLSGNSTSIGAGTMPSVAAGGDTYGIAYVADRLYFTTLTQNNTIQLAKTQLDDTSSALNPALAWDGANFGAFYKDNGAGYLEFRKITAAGNFSPASRVDVGQPSGGGLYYDSFAIRLPNQTWLMTGWGAYHSANWAYHFIVTDNYVPSPYVTLTTPLSSGGRTPSVAVSGDSVGLVWMAGDATSSPPHTLEFSLRDRTGVNETKHVQLRPDGVSARKAVIAPRASGGFGILWSESDGVYFQEYTSAGSTVCSNPFYKTFANFEPDQMVATTRGYLAVSSYNHVVQAQEVLVDCTYGTSFPNIATTSTNSDAPHARIAAGAKGFAMVWSDNTNVYTRTFGPNLCN